MSLFGQFSGGLGGGLGAATVYVDANITKLQKDLAKARAVTDQSTSATQKNAAAWGMVRTAASGAALYGIAKFGSYAVKSAMEAQQAMAQTTSTIKSMGIESQISVDHVTALSNALADQAGIDDETIQGAANLMLTFRNAIPVFDRATQAAVDLSVRFGQDMNRSAIMVGKALQDPVKGLTNLSRIGIQFSEDQKKTIEAMMKTGDVAGAQGIIFGELEKQVGGAADAYGKTLAGSLGRAKKQMEDSAEVLGSVLTPALGELAKAAGGAASAYQDAFETAGELMGGGIDTSGFDGMIAAEEDAARKFAKGEITMKQYTSIVANLDYVSDKTHGTLDAVAEAQLQLDNLFQRGEITQQKYQNASIAVGKGQAYAESRIRSATMAAIREDQSVQRLISSMLRVPKNVTTTFSYPGLLAMNTALALAISKIQQIGAGFAGGGGGGGGAGGGPNRSGATGESAVVINLNGDVYDANAFETRVVDALDQAVRKRSRR